MPLRRSSALAPVLLLGLAAPLIGIPRPAPPARTAPAAVERLDEALRLVQRWLRLPPVGDPQAVAEVAQALADLDVAWDGCSDGRRAEVREALLDFLGREVRQQGIGLGLERVALAPPAQVQDERELRQRVTAILRRRREELRAWLTRDVLVRADAHPVERRLAACEVLRGDEAPEVVLALFTATRDRTPAVLDAAVAALAGRDEPAVHARLVELLEQADAGELELWSGAVEAHFQRVDLDGAAPEGVERVRGYVAAALAGDDWRRASRGVAISRCLPHEAAFPTLIRGLELWVGREADANQPVRRVQGELEAELGRRSGRSLGPRPERWAALYEAWQRGEVRLDSGPIAADAVTRAGFFGLRPVTDRVTFVLDCSGSMEADFGTRRGHSRLDEAVEQMQAFLEQLGPRTRFDVVAFNDGGQRWKSRLRPATPANLHSACAWVHTRGPRGGTDLRAGVALAMHLEADGELDLEHLETDTVIVLCDGATNSGASWVQPLLRRVNGEARLVFHAVQIGLGGDGSLELLAEESGGEFVRVAP
ncbi:MAG: VWA domain-containing protein [Planctomycetes bacterium]|nr:VWA domain-containing protein [Planctomycetota bacterium]